MCDLTFLDTSKLSTSRKLTFSRIYEVLELKLKINDIDLTIPEVLTMTTDVS